MISFTVSSKKISEEKTKCFGFLLFEKNLNSSDVKACEKMLGISIADYLKQHDFTGKHMQTFSMPVIKGKALYHLIFVGLGASKKITVERYRRSLAQLYRQASAHKAGTLAVSVPPASSVDLSLEEFGQQSATIISMAAYHYKDFLSDKKSKKPEPSKIIFCVISKDKAKFEAGVRDGEIIAESVNKARDWVNTPPSRLTPPDLAKYAKAIAKKHGLKFTQFSEAEIIKKGMGGLASVGRGSDNDCQLTIMEYKSGKKNADTIAFVGKGITFDSGGLSLKPAAYMETMKEDMSGAAAVIATMEAIAQLKPSVNVIGVTPLAENLPSGKASKPGDIVEFYNGKTAEIKNTDAEGRLVLADALAYAVKHYKPDAIIDIATLTGACAYALGPFYTGLMSQHDDLAEIVEESAEHSGDLVWRLPLSDDYEAAVKSDVADLSNIGQQKYMAGAVTAAMFLKPFVGDTPWVHLDIAGTAFNVPDRPYFRTGSTGVGVRLLVDIAQHWK